MVCLQVARFAAIVGAIIALILGAKAGVEGDYPQAALLILIVAPVSIGHAVAFKLAVHYARKK